MRVGLLEMRVELLGMRVGYYREWEEGLLKIGMGLGDRGLWEIQIGLFQLINFFLSSSKKEVK